MKKRTLCALFAAVILAAGISSGCSGGGNVNKSSSGAGKTPTKIEKSIVSENDDGSLAAINVSKVNHVKIETENVDITASGIIYQGLDGKYGVISTDGSKNTGAVYSSVAKDSAVDKGYFVVRNAAASDGSLNTAGLIDRNGEKIIECKYAAVEIIGEQYAAVYTADRKTSDKNEAVVGVNGSAASSKIVTPHFGDNDEFYSGEIGIFDLKHKKTIALPSQPDPQEEIKGKGTFIVYKDRSGKEITADSGGAEVTDGRTVLANGSYVRGSTVYSGDGKMIFGFDDVVFSVIDYMEPYYIGCKSENNVKEYYLIDKSGKKSSPALGDMPAEIFPDYMLIGTSVCKTTDGTAMFGGFSSLKWDSVNKDAYLISNTNEDVIIFDKDGGIVYNGNYRDDKINGADFNLYKNSDYFNCKERSFSINASDTVANWLVSLESGGAQKLIETRTGATLIENCGRYAAAEDCADHTGYIYAFSIIDGQTYKGDFDVINILGTSKNSLLWISKQKHIHFKSTVHNLRDYCKHSKRDCSDSREGRPYTFKDNIFFNS